MSTRSPRLRPGCAPTEGTLRASSLIIACVVVTACKSEPPKEPAAPPPPATPAVPAAPSPPPAPPFGTVQATRGSVTVTHDGKAVDGKAGASVERGDVVATGHDGKVRLALLDQMVVALGADSRLTLAQLDAGDAGRHGKLVVSVGKFWAQVTKWTGKGESAIDFETPSAVAGVRGTTLWGDVKVDAICALEGTIEVRSLKAKKPAPVKVTAGNCAARLSKGQTAKLKPTAKQVAGYLGEVLIKD